MTRHIIILLILSTCIKSETTSRKLLTSDMTKTYSNNGSTKYGHKWGVASNYGAELYQQDRYQATVIEDINHNIAMFYACYDGHISATVAEQAKHELPLFLVRKINIAIGYDWIVKLLNDSEKTQIKATIRYAILTYDKDALFTNGIEFIGGSTMVMIIETKYHMIAINLGDSQARIYSRISITKEYYRTQLHTWKDFEEIRRAENAQFFIGRTRLGIFVKRRINGNGISIPRGLGDNFLKTKSPWSMEYGGILAAISPVATVDIIDKVLSEKYIIVLTSDGIGDLTEIVEKDSEKLKLYPHLSLNKHIINDMYSDNLERIARKIVDAYATSTERRAHDNMGILIAQSSAHYGVPLADRMIKCDLKPENDSIIATSQRNPI